LTASDGYSDYKYQTKINVYNCVTFPKHYTGKLVTYSKLQKKMQQPVHQKQKRPENRRKENKER